MRRSPGVTVERASASPSAGDLLMPEMDGLQLAKEVASLRRKKRMQVIILSSVGLADREAAHVAAWLAKPVKPSALHDTLATVLLGGTVVAATVPATQPVGPV